MRESAREREKEREIQKVGKYRGIKERYNFIFLEYGPKEQDKTYCK